MNDAILRATALSLLSLVVGHSARAEIDSGNYGYRNPQVTADLRGRVSAGLDVGMLVEVWVVPASDVWSAAEFSISATPVTPFRDRFRTRRCPEFAFYTFRYAYETPDESGLIEIIEEFASDPDPMLTDRVLIDGETVGWRFRQRHLDGSIDEAWILTADYSPPRPTLSTPRTDAHQQGWARPYVDQIEVLDAPPDEVLAEAWLAAGDPVRLARYGYTPRPATPAQIAAVCPR